MEGLSARKTSSWQLIKLYQALQMPGYLSQVSWQRVLISPVDKTEQPDFASECLFGIILEWSVCSAEFASWPVVRHSH